MESSGSLLLLFSLLSHVCLFCDPMDCSLPGASVHEVPQARLLWWSGLPFSSGDIPDPGIESTSHALAGRFSTTKPKERLTRC